MIDFGAVLAFAIAAGLLTLTPGLDTALVLRTAAVEGTLQARLALAGICLGLLSWGSATSLGLTALLAISAVAYHALRIAGACYLVYLGVQMWRRKHSFQVDEGGPASGGPGWSVIFLRIGIKRPYTEDILTRQNTASSFQWGVEYSALTP